jgi:hypothetical protein
MSNKRIKLRESQRSDVPFMREMLYEAIYWRPDPGKPSPEEGLAALRNSHALVDWGERDGDLGVIALVDSRPAGAAWYRFYTELTAIRGYIEGNYSA